MTGFFFYSFEVVRSRRLKDSPILLVRTTSLLNGTPRALAANSCECKQDHKQKNMTLKVEGSCFWAYDLSAIF